MSYKPSKHTWYECPPDGSCRDHGHCVYCDGGLASCTVCHGHEGSLPTECPGEPMTPEQQDEVYDGSLDFRGGRWFDVNGTITESRDGKITYIYYHGDAEDLRSFLRFAGIYLDEKNVRRTHTTHNKSQVLISIRDPSAKTWKI